MSFPKITPRQPAGLFISFVPNSAGEWYKHKKVALMYAPTSSIHGILIVFISNFEWAVNACATFSQEYPSYTSFSMLISWRSCENLCLSQILSQSVCRPHNTSSYLLFILFGLRYFRNWKAYSFTSQQWMDVCRFMNIIKTCYVYLEYYQTALIYATAPVGKGNVVFFCF